MPICGNELVFHANSFAKSPELAFVADDYLVDYTCPDDKEHGICHNILLVLFDKLAHSFIIQILGGFTFPIIILFLFCFQPLKLKQVIHPNVALLLTSFCIPGWIKGSLSIFVIVVGFEIYMTQMEAVLWQHQNPWLSW